jgi:fused signal recognition particle receptor
MAWFEQYLEVLKNYLVGFGVPAEQGLLAALGLVYLALTLVLLAFVLLLVKRVRKRRSSLADQLPPEREAAEPVAADEKPPATSEPAAVEAEARQPEETASPVDAAGREAPTALIEPEIPLPGPPATAEAIEPASMFDRLRQGLNKTRASLVGRVDALLGSHARLDDDFIEELEEILITADFGMMATQELVKALIERMTASEAGDPARMREILAEEVRARLDVAPAGQGSPEQGPLVIMVVGVNGVGKTTTIGKLARQFSEQGKKVVLGAGDTFRAAADQQLQVWGERANAEVISHTEGSDPSAVAFDAARAALARKADVLILDTAGRLHTKVNLMEELRKMRRVLDREIPGAPHETLLVLDATTGQNALIQARKFQEAVEVSGVALTKLDGTAKGGIVVAIASQLQLPVRYIGVGEGVRDLRPFDPDEFIAALFQTD